MGKIIKFPEQPEQSKALRDQGFAAFAAANYQLAAQKYSDYLTIAENNGEPVDVPSVIQLGQAYLELKQIGDAVAVADDYLTDLSADEAGREFVLRAGMAAPDFTLITLALRSATTDDQSKRMRARADEFEAQYVHDNQAKIDDGLRQLAHIGGRTFIEQEQIVNELLPKLPIERTVAAIKRALVDPDVLPVMRTTLAGWLQRQGIDEEVEVFVYNDIYRFNPKQTKAPFADATVVAIINEFGQQADLPGELLEMMFVRVTLLYPVVGQIITDSSAFVKQILQPSAKTEYADLQRWMDEQLTIMGNLVNK